MPFTVDVKGAVVHCDTSVELLSLLDGLAAPAVARPTRTLADALGPKRKPGPKPAGKPGPKPRSKPAPLTPEERKAMSGDKPALICRPPHGCGKAFQSENRMAWYCTPCAAKRDEGRGA